jgi:hypothetical protein
MPQMAAANPYQINDIRVDVEGETAIDAREKALNQARRNAFSLLSERMGLVDQMAGVQTDDGTIASMVDSFEINREKLSKNRYLASVNVTFNERALQAYLRRQSATAMPFQGDRMVDNAQNINQNNVGAVEQQNSLNRQSQQLNTRHYVIQVNIADLRQWAMIRKRLEGIGNLKIDNISSNRAVITLAYSGEATNLQNDLNMKGMQLYRNTRDQAMTIPYVLLLRS